MNTREIARYIQRGKSDESWTGHFASSRSLAEIETTDLQELDEMAIDMTDGQVRRRM